jgi:hypothetical protein
MHLVTSVRKLTLMGLYENLPCLSLDMCTRIGWSDHTHRNAPDAYAPHVSLCTSSKQGRCTVLTLHYIHTLLVKYPYISTSGSLMKM